jgi:hypothetical protein
VAWLKDDMPNVATMGVMIRNYTAIMTMEVIRLFQYTNGSREQSMTVVRKTTVLRQPTGSSWHSGLALRCSPFSFSLEYGRDRC